MPIVADAAVKVGADMAAFNQDLKAGGEKGTRTLGQQLKGAFSPKNLAIAGVAGGIAIAGAITAGLVGAAKALIDIERLNAQTDAAIRSTGGVANVTREGVEAMGESLEKLTTIERETVQGAANMLLTFTKVRNEVGEGNDIFDQATEAALDMSVALGTDATSGAMLLGKALNDPVKGMTAMTRAGIQFTDSQKAMIKAMVASGDMLGAQTIILKEIETQFGGSAEAFARTTAGRIQRFQNDIGNFFEHIVLGFVELGELFADTGESLGTGFEAIGDVLGTEIVLWGDAVKGGADDVKAELDRMPFDAHLAATAAARNVYDAYVAGGPVIAAEAGKIAGMFPSEIQARVDEIRAAGANQVVEFAAGMLDKQNDPLLAMEALARANENALTRSAEIVRLLGQLNSAELAAGLNDNRPAVRLAAQAARLEITSRLETLNAYGWGSNVAGTLAQGMNDNAWRVRAAAVGLSSLTGAAIRIESEPSDPQSGLRGITKWGGNIVKTIADGIYGELGTASGAALALSRALSPGMSGGIGPMSASGAAPGSVGGGMTVNINAPTTPMTPRDIGRELRRTGAFGVNT